MEVKFIYKKNLDLDKIVENNWRSLKYKIVNVNLL